MFVVKIHCVLGLNIFLIPQFTIRNVLIQALKTQPLRKWQVHNDLCSAFGNLKTKKQRRFVIMLAPWTVPV
jgi:hypothetical protein